MGLVDYASDSNSGSDSELAPAAVPAPKPSTSSKPAFQKLTDSSGRIKVSLPTTATTEDYSVEQPPAKRAKTSGGAFSDFTSFLPAPKRSGLNAALPPPSASTSKPASESRPARAPVTLKGSGPAFSRSTGDDDDEYDDMGRPLQKSSGSELGLPPPKAAPQPSAIGKPAEEVKMVGLGKPMMFKPLSVGRRPVKKKKSAATTERSSVAATLGLEAASQAQAVEHVQAEEAPKPKQKVSLFSMGATDDDDDETAPASAAAPGAYQPMIYGAQPDPEPSLQDIVNPYLDDSYQQEHAILLPQHQQPAPPSSTNLNDIASDLNLSAAERRQLFGRSGKSTQSATKVINFNTDQEYQHNEAIRASGEPVAKNPVRAIAPGKHSLQQLVSQVQSQKEALEESFVRGRVNKKEAGSRYGW